VTPTQHTLRSEAGSAADATKLVDAVNASFKKT